MTILGIETSCDETAVAVLEVAPRKTRGEEINILSNVISSQVKLHAKYGGVVPNLAAREHVKNIKHVFDVALEQAKIKNFQKEIDLISVTRGPGLAPSLLVGIVFAKTLAWFYQKPIVGINHLEGHIFSNWLRPIGEFSISNFQFSKNVFPALNLIVSGGHTELVLMKNHGQYKLIGETLDDAIGEAFDKVARLLELGYPGGPIISKIAESGDPDKYPLPSPMINLKNYNFSYAGLKTAVLYLVRDLKKELKTENLPTDQAGLKLEIIQNIAASFQKAAIDVLIKKTIRAAKELKVKSILLSGGVSANKALREQLEIEAKKNNIEFFCPIMEFTTDNAAMIAVAGYFNYKKTNRNNWESIEMDANLAL